jgi:hypothetical protein
MYRIPRSDTGDDPVLAVLHDVANALSYDLAGGGRTPAEAEIVVELPPDGDAVCVTGSGEDWVDFVPSRYSRGRVAELCAVLATRDPQAGYDLRIRADYVFVCRWPARAWDVPPPAPPTPDPEPVPPEPDGEQEKQRRSRRRRRG